MQYFDTIWDKISSSFKEHKIEIIIGSISLLAFLASIAILLSLQTQDNPQKEGISFNQITEEPEVQKPENQKMIMVDLSGAVEKPNTYEIKEGTRLKELLSQANGLSKIADRDFFNRNFNLAKVLTDQEKIHIPSRQEVEDGLYKEAIFVVNSSVGGGSGSVAGVSTQNRTLVNINTASDSELDKLPGVGPVTVQKIVAGRPYGATQELLDNKIVNKSQWEKIKEMITVN